MKITKIETNKFKTNLCAIFLTLPLDKDTVTYNALIPAVLRRGTKTLTNQLEINKKLENMYGADFNCGIDKIGDFCVLKFYIEVLNNEYLPEKENLTKQAIELLKELVFNPFLINEHFDEEYVEQEKENLKKIILSRKDDKSAYSTNRCIEEMFKNEPFGIYKFGNIEDLKKINANNLYSYYKKMLENCKTDFFIAGNLKELRKDELESIESISNQSFDMNKSEKHNMPKEVKIVKESMDVSQGKLAIGLYTPDENKYAISLYNTVLGGGANSKLFQNVREKAGLAYSAGSLYIRRKNTILIKAGIEITNFNKAVKIIEEQIQDMKDGKISDQEFSSAKQLIVSSMKMIPESQQDLITYYFDQESYGNNTNIEDYIQNLAKITKKQVLEVAKSIKIDTIYFLQK